MKKIFLLLTLIITLSTFNTSASEQVQSDTLSIKAQSPLEALKTMAANGDTEALNILRLCYEDGCNVERDKQRAYQYYRMSAERGDSHGMFKTARIMGEIEIPGMTKAQRQSEAAKWTEKAAQNGYHRAVVDMIYGYSFGNPGFTKDDAKYFYWVKKAAEAGDQEYVEKLGILYYNGFGCPVDYKKALEWLPKGVESGNSDCMLLLGNCYYLGNGVPEDKAKGIEWYRKAAKAGNQNVIDWLNQNGIRW